MMRLLSLLAMVLAAATVRAEVVGEEVNYHVGASTYRGYIAYDDAIQGKRPGVLVVHEWWGHNDYARIRAEMLAEEGYIALAVDMYGDGKTADHPKEAGKFAAEAMHNMDRAEARFQGALKTLQKQPQTDPDKIAAIGYCFGGGVVLQMARRGLPLDGVASFHGSLATNSPAQKGQVEAKVAVFSGEDDPMVPPDQVAAFRKEMERAGVDYSVTVYPGVKHSFTNPQADRFAEQFELPLAYNEAADKDSWSKLLAFLDDLFD